MNRVYLKGNVGGDPIITHFDGGGCVAQFSLATTERGYTTKDGKEIPDITDWHNIVVKKSGLAGVVEAFVRKGSPLLIEGKIRTRTYQKDGVEKYVTEILVDELELLGNKEKREAAPAPEPEEPAAKDDLPF